MRGKALKFASIMGGVVGAIVIALGAQTLVDTFAATPTKPYDVAMYDVYSDLLQHQPPLYRLLDPQPKAILIRVETEPGEEPDEIMAHLSNEIRTPPSNPISKQVSVLTKKWLVLPKLAYLRAFGFPRLFGNWSAIADYQKRNASVLELQRNFNLPQYELFTKSEERALLKSDSSACQKYAGYERWVELSAVGFNQDQTVAVVHFIDWGARPCSHMIVGATGNYCMLQKRNGKWVVDNQGGLPDWILDLG